MLSPAFTRLGILWPALLLLVLVEGTHHASRPSTAEAQSAGLVVHEWGTFTSVTGREGHSLMWRPLTFESDLPSFVYSADKGRTWRGLRYPSKSGMAVTVRMETPVIYFYAKEETAVSIKVDFTAGRITEWYPRARSVSWGSIDWGELKVMPGAHVYLPHDFQENHYYPARETDAAPLRVRAEGAEGQIEHEKFLFYRGVGNFDLPLSVKLAGDKVVIKNVFKEKAGQVVLFESRGGKVGYRILDMPQNEVMLDRPASDGKLGGLRQEMKAMLISHGLYAKEADAMLNTWRNAWFEEGLRVFYVLPRKTTDEILPIAIQPQPAGLVRVLVGRTELITPEMEQDVTTEIPKLQDPSSVVREAARNELNKYGRFLEPILMQIHDHTTDPELKLGIKRLLQEME